MRSRRPDGWRSARRVLKPGPTPAAFSRPRRDALLRGIKPLLAGLGAAVSGLALPVAAQRVSEAGAAREAPLTSHFSGVPPGIAMPDGWHEQRLSDRSGNRYAVVQADSLSVLQIESRQSASSLLFRMPQPVRATRLSWRWRTDGWPDNRAPFGEKAGDDFSLRLYLMFDYPLGKVPFAQRLGLRLARALHGDLVPAATLCYVADPRVAADTVQASPYTARVQVMVLRSSEAPGAWWSEQRDLLADFQRAFGAEYGPGMPPIAAVALAADTDQGGGAVRAWFSDLQWTLAR
jgi:hypothetical protein